MLHRWGVSLRETVFLDCNFDPLLRELGTTKELLARNAREEGGGTCPLPPTPPPGAPGGHPAIVG